jgi:hypothetical protein
MTAKTPRIVEAMLKMNEHVDRALTPATALGKFTRPSRDTAVGPTAEVHELALLGRLIGEISPV